LTVHRTEGRIDVVRLGRTEYRACWELQKQLQQRRIDGHGRDLILLTEHDPVITMGATANADHLLAATHDLSRDGIDLVEVDRGGDVTYHGPGQIVGYPILDLAQHGRDLHRYLRAIEEMVMDALASFDVQGSRIEGYTGVWVGTDKICAIGINVRRWVSMHGFALNVTTDLRAFRHIIPCGIFERGVTSLAEVLGHAVAIHDVEDALLKAAERIFESTLHEYTCKELGIDGESLQRRVTGCV
jgi:lipoyl(octanoyl) transferase